jgi:hypothetical protein
MLGLRQIWAGGQFFLQLPGYLRRPLTLDAARLSLSERLSRRDDSFLEKLRLDIYEQPSSPYLQLLRHAGCEFEEIESGVRRDGLEATLRRLFQAGVYLTVDEFKGRKAARRGSAEFPVRPEMLQAPRASYHLPSRSGGSRSEGTPVMTDLSFIRTCAANSAVSLGARGQHNWRKTIWESPGAGLRFRTVKYAGFGDPPSATFSQVDPDSYDIPAYFRWNLRLMCWVSPLARRPIPWPVYAPLSDPSALAGWLRQTLRAGATPHLQTFPGSAVVLSRWAIENDYDISGTWLTVAGEPITPARRATMKAAGCHVIPRYGSMETGAIGYGCAHGQHADDMHLLSDMYGVIQAGNDVQAAGLPATALLITSLHPQSPFVMLNLSMGDQAEMSRRRCGCPLEEAGWSSHLWNVRSFEKLTSGSVTFEGTALIPVLEETLPARFGGESTDYQLAEAESAVGEPVLELIVHPRLGELDEQAIAEEFLSALSRGSASDGMMIRRWRDAGTLRVERREPSITKAGKINYLHV